MRLAAVFGFAFLGMALLIGVGAGQERKKEKASGFPAAGLEGLLDLSADQKDKAYKVLAEFKTKLNVELNDSIKKLKAEEKTELGKILTGCP